VGQPTPAPPQPEVPALAGVLTLGGTTLVSLAAAHRARQVALSAHARSVFARLWRFLDPRAPQVSWARLNARAVALLAAAQGEAARGVNEYVAAALAMQGATPDPVGLVPARAFAGHAADGRDLAGLLSYPAFQVDAFVSQGMSPQQASAIGARHLDRIVATEVSDAARVATGVAVVGDRAASGYVRMLTPPSCSRCVVLAGRWYAVNAGFLRHPQCFPAGTVVSGPKADGATRRWYQGELVIIRTASGKNLTVTANHPILTSQGWMPASLLCEGGDVVSRSSGDRSGALVVPDHDQMPTGIEDLWRSDGMSPLGRMPVSAEDFHGDGPGSSHVDVVLADRFLWDRQEAMAFQELSEKQLPVRAESSITLTYLGARAQLGVRDLPQVRGMLSRARLGGSLRLRHPARANESGLAWSTDDYSRIHEAFADHGTTDAEPVRERVLAFSREVVGRDSWPINVAVAPRWDAPAVPFSMESRVAYASSGNDLRFRLAGKVEIDRVVDLRRVQWSGHVYNLTSREGWYDADGIIVSNCDCVHIPAAEDIRDEVRTDPTQYFDSLTEAQQDAAFTRAGAQAIRDGADIAQVVNARRGAAGIGYAAGRLTEAEKTMLRGGRQRGHLERASVFGQDLFVTTEGTTTRGAAGVRLGARETGRKTNGSRYRVARAPRLMPESIYEIAGGNRDEAIRLLKRNGYIT
jgi:hypothetical protein